MRGACWSCQHVTVQIRFCASMSSKIAERCLRTSCGAAAPLPAGATGAKPLSASSITWKFFCRPLLEPAQAGAPLSLAASRGVRRVDALPRSKQLALVVLSLRGYLLKGRRGLHAASPHADALLYQLPTLVRLWHPDLALRLRPNMTRRRGVWQRTALDGLLHQAVGLRDVHNGDVHLVGAALGPQRGRPGAEHPNFQHAQAQNAGARTPWHAMGCSIQPRAYTPAQHQLIRPVKRCQHCSRMPSEQGWRVWYGDS